MKKILANYKGLPKEIYIICLAQLINRLGDFVVPFLALYLTQKIGMSAAESGIIVTLSTIIGIPAALIGGKVSDVYGRKKVYMYAQSISALALIPCAITRNVVATIVCLLISTFFNGFVRPAFDSMVTDILSNKQRQAGFSLKYLSINVGVSIGPMIAGFLFNKLLPMLFIGDAITSLVAVFLIGINVQETHKKGNSLKVENKAEKEEKGNLIHMFLKRPYLLLFLLLNIVYSYIYNQHKFSLPMTLNHDYVGQGAKLFGYLMSINAITVLVLTVFISAATKKNHQLANMVIAGILYAFGFGMIGYIHNFGFFILSTIIWTGGEILCSISAGVYVANNSPSNYRARLNALRAIGNSIGASFGTGISGYYIQHFGYNSIWNVIFITACVAVLFMFLLYKHATKVKRKEFVTT